MDLDNSNIDKDNSKREKIAIVVFFASILIIFAGVATYMFFSHSFDYTASDIDDNVGQLNDYAAIIFKGNNTQRALVKKSEDQEKSDKDSDDDTVYEAATVDNVSDIYQDKSATIVHINTTDYTAYTNGEIIERGQWRIGVLSITPQYFSTLKTAHDSATAKNSNTTPVIIEEFQKTIDNLRKANHASMVILITPDSEVGKYVKGIDCMLAEKVKDTVPDEGKSVDSCYLMPIPRVGQIGAIVSSPAKSLSGNVYTKVEVTE